MKGEKGAPRVGSLRLPSASRAARERQHVERSAHSTVEARARRPRFAGSGFGSSPTRARVGHLDLRVRRVSTVSQSRRGGRGLAGWRGVGVVSPVHRTAVSKRTGFSTPLKKNLCESVIVSRACSLVRAAASLRPPSRVVRSCARENRTYYASTLGNSRVVLIGEHANPLRISCTETAHVPWLSCGPFYFECVGATCPLRVLRCVLAGR